MRICKLVPGVLAAGLAFAIAMPAAAQFGGLVGGGKKDGVDVGKALAAGTDLIGYVTVATALGNQAADLLVDMYPPEKMVDIANISKAAAGAKAKAPNGNVDAEQMKAVEDKSAILAKMQADGQLKDYKKDKLGNVSKAYGKLGLMVLADGVAGTKIKPTVDGLQAALNQVSKDPTQAGKLESIKYQIATLTAVGAALPKQVSSANTVRSICSQISAAEKVPMPADLSADKVKDLPALKTASIASDGP